MELSESEIEDQKNLMVVERFRNRESVQNYFKLIKSEGRIDEDWLKIIRGIGEEVKEDISDLFHLYGITACFLDQNLNINHDSWWIDLKPLSDSDLDLYLPLFFQEFSLYPVTYVKNSKLKKIYFCNSLDFSTTTYSQYRAAVPDYSCKEMSMIYCCKERSVNYITNVIHHEYFHFVDYVDDGKIYGPDPEWESLNEPSFSYGNGGALNREWKPLDPNCVGFLNFYSTTAIEEDKAELFAYMMQYPHRIATTKCGVIRRKFDYLRQMMERFDCDGIGSPLFWDMLMCFRLSA